MTEDRLAARTTVDTAPDPGRWPALALLAVVNFMVILDSQIVILALPPIETGLGFSPDSAHWVMSAYLLGFGGLLLLGGRLGDLLGRRRIFLIGTALFGLASLVCGLATRPEILIAARAIHGVSAALMAPTALAILVTTFADESERLKALAVWGGVGGLGATAALVAGGAITDVLGWEWIFFLNLPVAAGLLLLGPRLLRESRDESGSVHGFDPTAAITLTAGLALLCAAVVEAPNAGWTSPRAVVLFGSAAALLALFCLTEARSPSPLIPLSTFRSRRFVGANTVMLLIGMVAWGIGLIVSLYAQRVLGYSPLVFGLGTAVLTVMAMAGSYAAQALLGRLGVTLVASSAALLLAAGALVLTGVSVDGNYFEDLFAGLVLVGTGLGAGTVAASVAALSDVDDENVGIAAGVNTAAFQIGGALGAAIVTTVATGGAADAGGADVLTAGFRAGFAICMLFAAGALVAASVLLRTTRAVR